MKIRLYSIMLILAASPLKAQTARAVAEQINRQNRVANQALEAAQRQAATPEYRFVTNQLFDISKSKLWRDYQIEVSGASTNGIFGRAFSYGTRWVPGHELSPNQYGVQQGMEVEDRNLKHYGGCIVVLNPGVSVATGQTLTIRALPLGTTNSNGVAATIIDCGITPEENARRKSAANQTAQK